MSTTSHQIRKVIPLAFSSFIVSLLIFLSNALGTFELKAYDLFSRYLNPATSSDSIVIIQIDQPSIDALSKEGITWPWPRQIYAPIVEYLSRADAVFMDILFTEPSSYGQEDDTIFAEAVKKTSNVYLPIFLTQQEKALTSEDEEFIKHIAIGDKIYPALIFNSPVAPVDVLKNSVKGSGNVTISPDEDGVYRRIPLVFGLKQYTIPNFILSYLIEKGLIKIAQGSIYAQDTRIPLTDGRLLIRYSKEKNPFKVFSAVDILSSYQNVSASKNPAIQKDFFKGKVVFIGLTAAGLYDLKPTSVSSISTGIFILATALDNIATMDFIRPVSRIFVIAIMLFICFSISYFVLRSYSLLINLSIFSVSLLIVIVVLAVLFKEAIYINIISPVMSLVMSFIIAVAYSYAVEGRERLFLSRTFSQYMDTKVADYLLRNPNLIKPGGQVMRVAIFFADIAGFTSISEKISADRVATMLHRILNSLTEVIIKGNGVIDKYIGDCIMAFWGAPIDTDRDEINACHSAIRCLNALDEINKEFRAEGFPEINIRIGIHSGDAIAGNIGSDRLFHYTVIGDAVNLASRLESVNKFFKTRIIVSEDTLKETGDIFFARELGLIEVKGKTKPVKIFELISEKENIQPDKKQMVVLFNQAMSHYMEQRWHEAIEIFNKILENYPHDWPSELYKKRCEILMSNPHLTDDWNVIKMTEK
ncbi:MAG: CHASE2 domain-containing protein [Ignavibacteriales bacterium]